MHAFASDQQPADSLSWSTRLIMMQENLTDEAFIGCPLHRPGHVGSRNKGLIPTKDSLYILTLDPAFAIVIAFLVQRNRVWQGFCPIAVRINRR
jgi:hypothetical protein